MKPRVVERPAALSCLEHRRHERECDVAGDSCDEHVERLRRGARVVQEGPQLDLSDVDTNAAQREIGLYQLLERVVPRSDRQQVELERAAASLTKAIGP